jgi:hypothetical protein
MHRHRKRKQTLLGEAFDMKDSAGWQDVADSMHIQEKIAEERRRLVQRLALGILLLLIAVVVLFNCL